MNTNLDRAVKAIEILADEGRDPTERYEEAMKALDGAETSSLAEDFRQRIEGEGQCCNLIRRHNPVEAPSSEAKIDEEDARQLVSSASTIAETLRDAAIEAIMARLRSHDGKLPIVEIQTARRHRALFTPILLAELRDSIQWSRENPSTERGMGYESDVPFFTFWLMFEQEDATAVPIILESLHLPGEAPFDLYGDVIHEYLAQFLACFLPDKLDQIEDLIRDPDANLYVRWASTGAISYLVRDEKLRPEDAIARLTKLFFECRVIGEDGRPGLGHHYELSAAILNEILKVGGTSKENIPDTDEVWDFVEEQIVSREEFYDNQGLNLPTSPTRIEDCLSELKNWACFNPPPKRKSRLLERMNRPGILPEISPETVVVPSASTVRASENRVGRNHPCPCGSGKKYKKCCMRKNET
jgi:hypothetical protein